MGVVALLANGALQQLIQPVVMGATLGLNPLVVLVVTIGAGALFGMVGLTLAAPVTSAAVHISNELRSRSGGSAGADPAPARHDPQAQAGRMKFAAQETGAHRARAHRIGGRQRASLADVDVRIVAIPAGERITPNG